MTYPEENDGTGPVVHPAKYESGMVVTVPLEEKAVTVITQFWSAHADEVNAMFKEQGLEILTTDIVKPHYERVVRA